MTEHEQLKWICDTIGYESNYLYDTSPFGKHCVWIWYTEIVWDSIRVVDPREIIFTTEFMERLWKTLPEDMHYSDVMFNLHLHLDDPVSYLYNLLKWQ